MAKLTIQDLPRTNELDCAAMAQVFGGEKTMKDLPKDKPIKLTLENGGIVGEWSGGLTLGIPLF